MEIQKNPTSPLGLGGLEWHVSTHDLHHRSNTYSSPLALTTCTAYHLSHSSQSSLSLLTILSCIFWGGVYPSPYPLPGTPTWGGQTQSTHLFSLLGRSWHHLAAHLVCKDVVCRLVLDVGVQFGRILGRFCSIPGAPEPEKLCSRLDAVQILLSCSFFVIFRLLVSCLGLLRSFCFQVRASLGPKLELFRRILASKRCDRFVVPPFSLTPWLQNGSNMV